MATYESPITRTKGNIVIKKDGSVWATYILQGINVSSLDPDTLQASESSHKRLFQSLRGDAEEIRIHALKGRIPARETLLRMKRGFPEDASDEKYPLLSKKVSVISGLLTEGRLRQFRRVYMLEVRLPNPSIKSGFLSLFVNVDTSSSINPDDFSKKERMIFSRIPKDFQPIRSNDHYLRFAHDRARLRGLAVPEIPSMEKPTDPENVIQGLDAILVDGSGETIALTENLVDMIRNDEGEELAQEVRKGYRANFRTLASSISMSVHNIETRSDDLPDGLVSYQQHAHVAKFPPYESNFNLFRMAEDGSTGLDVDWTVRFIYSDDLSKQHLRGTEAVIRDNQKISKDEDHDFEDATQLTEINEFRQLRFDDSRDHTTMRVSIMFSFAAPSRIYLQESTNRIFQYLRETHRLHLQTVPGAYLDDYRQSLPCNPSSKLMTSYEQTTTISQFAGIGMMHQTQAGDPNGIPIAICTEDDNGTFIHVDYLSRPDRGNPSEIFEGSQGSGKSYTMKARAADLLSLHAIVHSFDPSAHGEYEKFFAALSNIDPWIRVQSINLASGQLSFDPVKVYSQPEDFDLMIRRFERFMMPLLNVAPESAAAEILIRGLKERDTYNIKSTRDLMDNYLALFASGKDNSQTIEDIENIRRRANHISQLPYGRGMIDPIGQNIPPIDVDATAINFRVSGLEFPERGEKFSEMTTEKQLTATLMESAAIFTSHRFANHKGLCATIIDELHIFTSADKIIKELAEKPLRMGRKESNLLYGGSQEPEHFERGFKEVANHNIHRLDRKESAKAALTIASLPEDESFVEAIRRNTSPLDPRTKKIQSGREGECWYVSSGSTPVRAKVLPMLFSAASRAADTTASELRR